MLSIESLRNEVEQWIKELDLKRTPQSLYTPIEYSLSLGGKRIRPVMCLATCSLFTDDYQAAKPAALAIEMFHNFTLLHDDVMDKATVRRNKPTVCAKWNNNVAILSGDQMLIESYRLLAQTDSPAYSLIFDTFNQVATEVCEGQQYDMDFEKSNEVSISDYMEMIRKKTAVLIAGSVKIGALVGGAAEAEVNALYKFAENIGLAFQLQDDLLDPYGDEKTFGKKIGGDIVENKKTFLLVTALEKASPQQARELTQWLNAEKFAPEEKIVAVRNIYDAVGVKAITEARINQLFDEAMGILREMEISAEGKRIFANFIESLIKRTR